MNLHNQLDYLVGYLKANKQIDYDNDWKMMTILIGANDLCLSCFPEVRDSYLHPDSFETVMRDLIYQIRTRIPRVFVNYAFLLPVSQVHPLTKNSEHCHKLRTDLFHQLQCICAFLPEPIGSVARKNMDTLNAEFNKRIQKIIKEEQANNYTDFAITGDPGMWNIPLKSWPIDVVSNTDCFHPSKKAHALMASEMWNGLFLSSEEKYSRRVSWTDDLSFFCPTEDSRFRI
jgi:phospholipase B1